MSEPVFVSESDREALRRLIRSKGARPAALALEVHALTMARAAAGMPVQRGTATHLHVKLEALEAAKGAAA